MSFNAGTITIALGVTTSGVNKAIRDTQRLQRSVQASAAKINSSNAAATAGFAAMSEAALSFGRVMTTFVTFPLLVLGGISTRVFSEFEFNLAKVTGLVGIAAEQTNAWGEEIKSLSSKVGQGPGELAEALYLVTTGGIRGAETMEVLELAAKASAAGMGETKEVVDILVSAMNAYGKENLSAAQAADILTATVREGKAEADKLVQSMGVVLPIASKMGVSFAETGAAMAAMTRTGTKATTAAQQLRQILNKLVRPAEHTEVALGAMGTSAAKLRQEIKDKGLLTTLIDLNKLTKKYGDTAISEVFPRIRALTGVLDLVGENMAENVILTENIINAQGDLNRAFDTASNTWKFKWNQTVAEGKTLLVEWGQAVATALIPALQDMMITMSEWGDRFKGLTELQQQFIVKTLGIAAAVGPMIILFTILRNSVIIPLYGAFKILELQIYNTAKSLIALNLSAGVWVAGFTLAAAAVWAIIYAVRTLNKESGKTDVEIAIGETLGKVDESAAKAIVEQRNQLEQLNNVLKSNYSTNEQRADAIQKLNDISPTYFSGLQEEEDLIGSVTERSKAYIDSIERRTKARELELVALQLQKDRIEALASGRDKELSFWEKARKGGIAYAAGLNFVWSETSILANEQVWAAEKAAKATEIYKETQKGVQDELAKSANNVDDLVASYKGLSKTLKEGLPEDKSSLKATADRIKTQIEATTRYVEYTINANDEIYKDSVVLQTLLTALQATTDSDARTALQNRIIAEKSAMNSSFAGHLNYYQDLITALQAYLKEYDDEINKKDSPRVLANLDLDIDLKKYNMAMDGLLRQNIFFGDSFDLIGAKAKLAEKTLKKVSTNLAVVTKTEVKVLEDGSEIIVRTFDKRVVAIQHTLDMMKALQEMEDRLEADSDRWMAAVEKHIEMEDDRAIALENVKQSFMAAGVVFDAYGRQANKTAEDIITLDFTLKDLEETLDDLKKNKHLFDEDDMAQFEEFQRLLSQETFVAQTNDMQSDMDQLIQKQKDLGSEYNLNNEKLSLMKSHLRNILNANTEGWNEDQVAIWKEQVALAKDNVEILEAKLQDVNQLLSGTAMLFSTLGDMGGEVFGEYADKIVELIRLMQSLIKIGEFVNTVMLAQKTITIGAAMATSGETAAMTASTGVKAANAKASSAHAGALVGEAVAIHAVSVAAAGGAIAGATLAGTAVGFPALLAAIPLGVGVVMTALGSIPAAAAMTALAKGGEIPPGYPNDNFPARLTSGEMVIPKDKVPAGASFEQVLSMLNETNNISNSNSQSTAATNTATKRINNISNVVNNSSESNSNNLDIVNNKAFEFNTLSEKTKEFTHMAKGGKIPPGFPNDNFPTMLTSGEIVLPTNQIPPGASFETVLSMLNETNNTDTRNKESITNSINNRNSTRNEESVANSTNTNDVINNAVKTRQTAFDAVTNIQNKTTNSNPINRTKEQLFQTNEQISNQFQTNKQVNNQYDEITGSIQYTDKIKNIPRLASGGIIPPGYPNDSYPAMLTSGERITPPQALPEFDGLKGLFGEVKFEIEGEVITGILEIMNSKSQAF